MKIISVFLALLLSACSSNPITNYISDNPFQHTELLLDAEQSIESLINADGHRIPEELLGRAKAFVVFPDLVKAAMIAGARVGKGIILVRSPKTGKWNPPAFIKSRQASYGFQAGIQKAEIVLVVVTKKGLRELFKTQFDLGAGPELAIGPLGKKMDLNLQKVLLKKDIYAYSSIKGLFAGVSLKGTVVNSDNKANREYYRQKVNNRILLSGHPSVKVPESGQAFLERLNKLAPPY
ncbi:MAG: lipid-binding SYLF domain-containing protein [Nitrospinae bacterium]|nr:lipid-binding SYLF domain-containing protein [Nitrospinota bacterium]